MKRDVPAAVAAGDAARRLRRDRARRRHRHHVDHHPRRAGPTAATLVRGRKVWTTKAPCCQKVLLLVRTTPLDECAAPHRRHDAAPRRPAAARGDITPIPKLGRNAVVSCEVRYDDLFVADDDRVGEEGDGFRYLLDGLNPERILIAAEALGIGRVALRRAVAYANERVVFGRPIGQNQGIAFPLAEAHMRLRAAELVVREAALALRPADCRAASRPTPPSGWPPRPASRRRRPGGADPRRHGLRRRVRRRALLARGAADAPRPDHPGDGPELRRRARPRPPPLVLTRPRVRADGPSACRRARPAPRTRPGSPAWRAPRHSVPSPRGDPDARPTSPPCRRTRPCAGRPAATSPRPGRSPRRTARAPDPLPDRSGTSSSTSSARTSRACGRSPSSPWSSTMPACSVCTAASSASTCSSSSPASSSPA